MSSETHDSNDDMPDSDDEVVSELVDMVESLNRSLDDLDERLSGMKARQDAMKRKLNNLEEQVEGDSYSGSGNGDDRDAAVVSAMEEGKTYSREQMKRLYLQKTDITNSRTAKDRAKNISHNHPDVEMTGFGKVVLDP